MRNVKPSFAKASEGAMRNPLNGNWEIEITISLFLVKNLPFPFVFDELSSEHIVVKPMFGCHALYRGDQILLILRSRADHPDDNGVWVATSADHHASLRKELPALRSIRIFGPGESSWQNIPAEMDDFESEVLRACELIRANDPRIGRIPAKKKKKSKT